jgi:hypothetical protein
MPTPLSATKCEYDGKPVYTVSIMDFEGDKVVHETLYLADPFEAPAWHAHIVERMPDA